MYELHILYILTFINYNFLDKLLGNNIGSSYLISLYVIVYV